MSGEGHPDRDEFHSDPIEHMSVADGMTVGEFVAEYANAGGNARDLFTAVEVYSEMVRDDDVLVVCGLAGAMVPCGMRDMVSELIRDGFIDVLVTTGATITHDSIEAIGGHHHHGSATPSTGMSREEHDEALRAEEVDRIYNVYLPQEHFVAFEHHLRENVFPRVSGVVSIEEFVRMVGRANQEAASDDPDSDPGIVGTAVECDVPVFCPAIQDSVLGIQAWMHSQVSDFTLDALADMTYLSDIVHEADRGGVIVVGGGVPKNYALQTMLVTPGAYEYGVQLTVDPEHTAGLTGASLDEARSWGKLAPSARNVTVRGDTTITFPLLVAATRDTLDGAE